MELRETMSSLWDNAFEQQKSIKLDGTLQVCRRCKLPYPMDSEQCTHCAHLDDDELEQLRQQYNQRHNEKKVQARTATIWAVIIISILAAIIILEM